MLLLLHFGDLCSTRLLSSSSCTVHLPPTTIAYQSLKKKEISLTPFHEQSSIMCYNIATNLWICAFDLFKFGVIQKDAQGFPKAEACTTASCTILWKRVNVEIENEQTEKVTAITLVQPKAHIQLPQQWSTCGALWRLWTTTKDKKDQKPVLKKTLTTACGIHTTLSKL